MKKLVIASLAVIGSVAVAATLALGGGPKLNAFFGAKATSKSFTFDAATGSQFDATSKFDQVVNVETGSSSPIRTVFMPRQIDSLAFGQNERFVEVYPIADENKFPNYSLMIGINNLTHFEIDMGVANDGGGLSYEDGYSIELLDKNYNYAASWYSRFEPNGDGNDTVHIEWDKGDYDGTVVQVFVELEFEKDSADTCLYIESLSLTWDC